MDEEILEEIEKGCYQEERGRRYPLIKSGDHLVINHQNHPLGKDILLVTSVSSQDEDGWVHYTLKSNGSQDKARVWWVRQYCVLLREDD